MDNIMRNNVEDNGTDIVENVDNVTLKQKNQPLNLTTKTENKEEKIEKNIENDKKIEEKIDDNSENNEEIEHVVHMKHTKRTIKIDENTKFGSKGKFSDFMFSILWNISYFFLWQYAKIFVGLKIKGKEKIKALKKEKKGYMLVSNHMLIMDAPLLAVLMKPTYVHFTSIESNFAIPVAGKLLSAYRVLPMTTNPKKAKFVYEYIIKALKEGKVVHMFPEGVLLPYHIDLKKFKRGAFGFAHKAQCPIVPVVFTQRRAKGPFGFLKKHHCAYTAHILDPIEINYDLENNESVDDVLHRTKAAMTDVINKYDERVYDPKY